MDNLEELRKEAGLSAVKGGYVPVPIHSNGGDPFDMMYAGNHPEVCPHIGKIVDDYVENNPEWKAKRAYF